MNDMTSYVFQEYKRGSRRGPTTEPRISITRTGVFSINRAAFEMLDGPAFVTLLYDQRGRAIAFRKATKSDPNAYPVRKQRNSASYLVSGKAFLQYIGEEYGENLKRLIPRKERDLVVVDLGGDVERSAEGNGVDPEVEDAEGGGLLDGLTEDPVEKPHEIPGRGKSS